MLTMSDNICVYTHAYIYGKIKISHQTIFSYTPKEKHFRNVLNLDSKILQIFIPFNMKVIAKITHQLYKQFKYIYIYVIAS